MKNKGMAQMRYEALRSNREEFLDVAVDCSRLTLPYLIRYDDRKHEIHKTLFTPWQSVGLKACHHPGQPKLMPLPSPPQTTFFKLQVNDSKLGVELPAKRSELDVSFSKIERMVMDKINGSSDRVVIHQAYEDPDRGR